jgi:hypothetical protein
MSRQHDIVCGIISGVILRAPARVRAASGIFLIGNRYLKQGAWAIYVFWPDVA